MTPNTATSATPDKPTHFARLPRVGQAPTQVGNYFVANYPPFSKWNAAVIPEFLSVLAKTPSDSPAGLYVHLPFCRQRCHYCYFRVYPRRTAEDVERYIRAVLAEFQLYQQTAAFHDRTFTSVYFGGGSPSYLTAEQLRQLLEGLQAISPWDNVEECTLECEPGTVDSQKFRVLKDLGVTRLSLGFQSLDDRVLRRNGRDLEAEDCFQAYRQARESGFNEINIDLIAGLPGETATTWRRTIEQVLALAPDCVTIYQLELTYNSALYASIRSGRKVPLSSWTTKRQWVRTAFEMFEQAGYAIGSGYMAIRNPAKWRFVYTVEHFWHGADLCALGETAFGYAQGFHYQNVDTYDGYVRAIGQNQFPIRRAYALSSDEKLRRELILQLKTGALDNTYYRAKFGVDLLRKFPREIAALAGCGFLEVLGNTICLTRPGLLQVDSFLSLFYLPEDVGIRYT